MMSKLLFLLGLFTIGNTTIAQKTWFANDGLQLSFEKMGRCTTDSIIVAKLKIKGEPRLPIRAIRIKNNLVDSSYRYTYSTLGTDDTFYLGTVYVPGIYEIQIDKIIGTPLYGPVPNHSGFRKYADSIYCWYNFFIPGNNNKTGAVITQKQRPVLSTIGWSILDSFIKKSKPDSINKKLDSSYEVHNDTIERNKKFVQYAIIFSTSADSYYRSNSITVITDTAIIPRDSCIKHFLKEILDTSSNAIRLIPLGIKDKIALSNEISQSMEYVDLILTAPEFINDFFLTEQKIEIGYWTRKYYLGTRETKAFNQLIFVVKEPK